MDQPTLTTIHTELVRLNGNLEKHVDLTKERQDRQHERIENHSTEIYGKGETSPGLKNNMTKVLLIQHACIWVIGVLATGIIGLLVNAAWTLITKKP